MFSRGSRNVSWAQTFGNVSIAIPIVVTVLGGILLDTNAEAGTDRAMAFALFGLVALAIIAAIVALFMMKKGEKVGVIVRSVIGLAISGLIIAGAVSALVGP